jgi:hypothetical protein
MYAVARLGQGLPSSHAERHWYPGMMKWMGQVKIECGNLELDLRSNAAYILADKTEALWDEFVVRDSSVVNHNGCQR